MDFLLRSDEVQDAVRYELSRAGDSILKHFFHILSVLVTSPNPAIGGWGGAKGKAAQLCLRHQQLPSAVAQVITGKTFVASLDGKGWFQWIAHAGAAAALLTNPLLKNKSNKLLETAKERNTDLLSVLTERAISIENEAPKRKDAFGETRLQEFNTYLETKGDYLKVLLLDFLTHTHTASLSGERPQTSINLLKEIPPLNPSHLEKTAAIAAARLEKHAAALETGAVLIDPFDDF